MNAIKIAVGAVSIELAGDEASIKNALILFETVYRMEKSPTVPASDIAEVATTPITEPDKQTSSSDIRPFPSSEIELVESYKIPASEVQGHHVVVVEAAPHPQADARFTVESQASYVERTKNLMKPAATLPVATVPMLPATFTLPVNPEAMIRPALKVQPPHSLAHYLKPRGGELACETVSVPIPFAPLPSPDDGAEDDDPHGLAPGGIAPPTTSPSSNYRPPLPAPQPVAPPVKPPTTSTPVVSSAYVPRTDGPICACGATKEIAQTGTCRACFEKNRANLYGARPNSRAA